MSVSCIDTLLTYFTKNNRKTTKKYADNIKNILEYIQHCIKRKDIEIDIMEKCIDILIENKSFIRGDTIEKILIAVCERCNIEISHRLVSLLRERVRQCHDDKIRIMYKMLLMKKFQICDENEQIVCDGELYEKYTKIKKTYNKRMRIDDCKESNMSFGDEGDNQSQLKYHLDSAPNNIEPSNQIGTRVDQGIYDLHTDKIYCLFDMRLLSLCNIKSLDLIETHTQKLLSTAQILTETVRLYKKTVEHYINGDYLYVKRIVQKLLTFNLETKELLFAYYFISFAHLFMAEYLECNFYIDKAINLSTKNALKNTAFFFLHFKFLCERLGDVKGLTPDKLFKAYFRNKVAKCRDILTRDTKFIANTQLSENTEIPREARTCDLINKMTFPNSLYEVAHYFSDYKFISFFTLNDKLAFNLIYWGTDNLLFEHYLTEIDISELREKFNSIMDQSRETLLRNIKTKKDTEKWWTDRIKLDVDLDLLVTTTSLEIEKYIPKPSTKLFVISDEQTSFFCWESMPIFSNSFMYRIPSFEYFMKVDYKNKIIKLDTIAYILDPENNLKNTKTKIQDFLDRTNMESIFGITNKKPDSRDENRIMNSSLFLYFGHGTGEKYLPKNYHQNAQNKAALVFGCSSSRLFCRKNFQRNGTALKYLESVANFLGCLWDVTDKDLDTFSILFLERLTKGNICAAEIVKSSKSKMKLKYLNGSALVLWGLPVKYVI